MEGMMKLYFRIRLMQMIIPVITGFVGFILALMWTAAMSIWVGVPQATDRIAAEWERRILARGYSPIWNQGAYNMIRAIAFLTIVAGWILLAYATVFIVKVVF